MSIDEARSTSGFQAETHDVVLRYHQAWKRHDLEAILALYHPQIAYHDLLQNRVLTRDELPAYVLAALPHGPCASIEHTDRIRIDGDMAFIQYRMPLPGGADPAFFCSSEAITVRDGLIWRVMEYATLQQGAPAPGSTGPARSALQRLGLSARQLRCMADDVHSYFERQRPFLDPDCNLPGIARATGYSRNQISYLLNQVLGLSFYRYVNRARLNYLLDRLADGASETRVDQLAFAAGFNSLSAFYRCFRTHTGQAPARYLRNLAGGSARTTSRRQAD